MSLAGNLAKSLAGIAACVVVRAHETHERLGGGGGGGVSERTGYEMRLARIAVEWTDGLRMVVRPVAGELGGRSGALRVIGTFSSD